MIWEEMKMAVKYKRIMLKISGEALAGSKGFGLDNQTITTIAEKVKEWLEK